MLIVASSHWLQHRPNENVSFIRSFNFFPNG